MSIKPLHPAFKSLRILPDSHLIEEGERVYLCPHTARFHTKYYGARLCTDKCLILGQALMKKWKEDELFNTIMELDRKLNDVIRKIETMTTACKHVVETVDKIELQNLTISRSV